MKTTVTEHDFRNAFRDVRPDNFSHEGLGKLAVNAYDSDQATIARMREALENARIELSNVHADMLARNAAELYAQRTAKRIVALNGGNNYLNQVTAIIREEYALLSLSHHQDVDSLNETIRTLEQASQELADALINALDAWRIYDNLHDERVDYRNACAVLAKWEQK